MIIEIPDQVIASAVMKEIVRKGFEAASKAASAREKLSDLSINIDGSPLEYFLYSGVEALELLTPECIRNTDSWNDELYYSDDFDAFWAKYYETKGATT